MMLKLSFTRVKSGVLAQLPKKGKLRPEKRAAVWDPTLRKTSCLVLGPLY